MRHPTEFLLKRCVLVGVLCALAGCAPLQQPSKPRLGYAPHASAAVPVAPPKAQLSPSPIAALQSVFKPEPLSMAWIGDTLRAIALESQSAANIEMQRLQALGVHRTPADKLKLAYLLIARAAPTTEEATQAQDLLRRLDTQTGDPASIQFIRVIQRLSRQTLELAQLRTELAHANKQVADLQDKIGQIKNLEVELQDRTQSRPGKTK